MRNFKFRGWDGIKFYHFNLQDLYSGARLADQGMHFEDLECIQEFTGLKDKDGKEIYEGDIVRFPLDESDIPEGENITHGIAVVEWGEGQFQVRIVAPRADWSDYLHDGSEVTGNIYEDAHLLNPSLLDGSPFTSDGNKVTGCVMCHAQKKGIFAPHFHKE